MATLHDEERRWLKHWGASRMKLHFTGDIAEIEAGLAEVGPLLGVERAADGLPVAVERVDDDRVEVVKRDDGAAIRYRQPSQFFRALGLLTEGLAAEGDLDIVETPRFDMVGPMIDVSQGNAVPTVETVKRMLRRMAIMGLDMIMLYAEDSYEVPERPWFGYMRGRYSADQMREIDDYAAMLGIELIPCIQTLGHLFEVLKWNAFADLRDDDWSLLVGHEPTYQFVEEMIRAASGPVRTKRIHIGMDEAWGIGQGRSLIQNGWRPKFELMTEHLERVLEITRRLGLQPMMWGDMFFRALSPTNSYRDVTIPPELARTVPQDVELIYWDYYEADPSRYVDLIRAHKSLNGEPPIFGGGIWNWRPWSLNYGYTFAATNAALAACKQEGVREIIATTWGDDGTECDLEAVMLGLQLFAEDCYHDEPSREDVFRR
ncbi:MAG TPA: beta-N-acetylhexosaminidase, partial [Thermomicrobiales bacterium]|nr:beta-N-acetylhexosaminidase [Thermomicrobiales bacterium]